MRSATVRRAIRCGARRSGWTPCSTTATPTARGRARPSSPSATRSGCGWPTQSRRLGPATPLTVYLRLIEPLKGQTGDSAYQQIARLLVAARACWQRLGRTSECTAYVTALRADQKRKRNLMRTLDQHNL